MIKCPSPKKPPSVCFVNILAYHIFTKTNDIPTGGAEFSLHERVSHLSPGYRVSIVTGDFGQPSVMNIGNITLYASVRLLHTSQIQNLFLLWKALRQASADIYVKSAFGKDIFPIWLFCKIQRKKFVYLTASDNECNGKNIQKYPLFGLLFKIALEHADYIITSVKHHKTLLKQHHPRISCPVEHIYHGLTLPEEENQREKNTILWLARCDPCKNPFTFIELAKRFPREQFTMIAAPQSDKKKLFDQVEQAAKQCKNITFIPGVPHKKAQQYFNEAKISVNTSDFEGFSMAFMQSGVGKTPILTLNLNPDHIITKHNLGYCAKGNFEQMVTQLHILLTDTQDWKRKSENINHYMREHHDIRKVIPQWETFFTSISTSRQTYTPSYHLSSLSHKSLLRKMYKNAREMSDSFIFESLKANGPFESIVDVGCWDGALTMEYAKTCNAKKIYGIEILQEKIDAATQRGIQCMTIRADKDRWPLEDRSIDCIVSNQLIEHLHDVDHFFHEASRVLKTGGILITSTNNLSSWHNIISLIFGWAPFDLTNSSKLVRGLGNIFSIHSREPSEEITMLHKCIYTPYWLFEWQKLYHLKKVSHFGAGLYPLPAILGNIFKRHAAFMVITTKKQSP